MHGHAQNEPSESPLRCRARTAAEILDVTSQRVHQLGAELGAHYDRGVKYFSVELVRLMAATRRARLDAARSRK